MLKDGPRRLRIFALALAAALLPLSCYAAPSKADVEVQFEKWVQADLWPEAKANGISEKVFQAAFSGITLNWNLPHLAPPGFPPPT